MQLSNLQHSTLPAAEIDWSLWISADEAGRLLGLDASVVRQRCRDQWVTAGLAMRCPAPQGGQARWWVRRSIDLRLAPGSVGQRFAATDLTGYSQRQRDTALARAACVQSLIEARSTWRGTQQGWLPTLVEQIRKDPGLQVLEGTVSERSLRRWWALYRTPADLAKLVDRRGQHQAAHAPREAWVIFTDLFLDERAPKIRHCWERTAEECTRRGMVWCSYKACCAHLDEHVPPELAAKVRTPELYKSKFRPYIQQDPEGWDAGQCWIGDHATLDFWVRFRGQVIRPTLTAWMDWRTRRVAGYAFVATPDSTAILSALRMGLTDPVNHGRPRSIWIDNGKDWDAWTFHGHTKRERLSRVKATIDETSGAGIFKMLGVDVHWSLAENPNGKARLERWFGIVHDRFDRTLPTYCGRTPEERPAGLNDFLKDSPGQVPTFDDTFLRLAEYIAGYNASAEHSKEDLDGLSPDAAMAAWCPVRFAQADPAVLDLLLQHWHRPVTVQKNGVTIAPLGMAISYGQYEDALRALIGTKAKVYVSYDPADMQRVRVWDDRWRLICTAPLNGLGGYHGDDPIAIDALRNVIRDNRRSQRIPDAAGRHHAAHRQLYSAAEQLRQAQREIAAAEAPRRLEVEAPLKLVQTPLDNAVEALEAEGRKKAAGAEFDSLPPSLPSLDQISGMLGASREEDEGGSGVLASLAEFGRQSFHVEEMP